ncbi:uncharacterized protein LOC120288365 [Eucalyptus grandis]|uniref:uncharacterized protein LOC120288365 n=1 Tax=Eucalyptus grandis TaxID=71139 RepID=UPI00192E8EDE|nr:uncharacterized protein LOC120288365 [Eucalyptus grandis]
MEEIIDVQEEELEEAATSDTLEFPLLTSLSLEELLNLRTFSYGKYCIHCPSLTRLTISQCPKMMTFCSFKGRQQSTTANIDLQQAFGCIDSTSSLLGFFNEKLAMPKLEELHVEGVQHKELWNNKILAESFFRLKVLKVKQCHNLMNVIPSSMWKRLLHCMESLTIEECQCLRNLFTMSMAKSLGQLQYLGLSGCGEMEYIVAKEEEKPEEAIDKIVIPQLVTLYLHNMPKLRSFCQGKHISEWPSLKEFTIEDCKAVELILGDASRRKLEGSIPTQQPLLLVKKVIPHLKLLELTREDVAMLPQHYIFDNLRALALGCYHDENVTFPSDFLLQGFPNLEELVVCCSSFEEIFPENALGHGEATPCIGLTDVEKPLKSLGNLKQLWLMELCNLRGVWKEGSLMAKILNQIEFMLLLQCPNLSIVFPSRASFERLMHLHIEECTGLVHMGTRPAMMSLVHLTRLTLRDCVAMEDVVIDDGDGAEEIPFLKLEELILDHLPSLESFSPTNCAFRFSSLERIVITQCPKMNIFCKGALRTPKLDKVLLSKEDGEGRWEGDLNTTVRTLSTCNDPQQIQ